MQTTSTVAQSSAAKEAFVFPLSFGQRRLWFLNQFDPASIAYNIPIPMRFNVMINRSVLERAVNELVRRHEILRTTFQIIHGEPMQVVAPSLAITVAYSDLRSIPADQMDTAAANLAFQDAQLPFSLREGPLIRVGLHRLGLTDHLLLISMHHIVADGWSVGVLFKELNVLYSAFCAGRSSPLPELRVQYADFAHWQAQTLKGAVLQNLLFYWKQQLEGAPETIELPTDRVPHAIASNRGGVHGAAISDVLYQRVRALGQQERSTPFMILLAIFQILLYRHTGETDLVVGTPIANRTKPQLEDLIGLFVNTLVIRTDLSGDPTFLDVLARVRETTLAAFTHQDMPFELLVEELQPSRNLNRNPLFQVMFLLQSNDPVVTSHVDSQHLSSVYLPATTAKFDLTMSVTEVAQGSNIAVEYCTDLFDVETIKRLTDRFIALIESAVSEPEAKISAMRFCSVAELQAVQPISGPSLEPMHAGTVWELVSQWAATRPNEIALLMDAEAITYQALAARADELADKLRAQGIPQSGLVEVCLDLSIQMVIEMFAISKAGGVPVMFAPGEKPVITANRGRHSGNDVACILYVPERDGQLRGVCIPHCALCRTNFGPGLEILDSDWIIHCTQSGDEFALFEIFAALAAGAHLVRLPADPPPPPRKLANALQDYQATIIIAPLNALDRVASDFPRALKNLRVGVLHDMASMPVDMEETLLQKLLQVDGAVEIGGYAFIRSPWNSVQAELGAVAAGLTVHLLDSAMRPVPVGVVGEIFYASSYMARGYHQDPVATAECFPGALHRSGQFARLNQDGKLIACGRRDRRIRIQGIRIAPEAVESVLQQHPNIEKSAVVPGSRGLTAFVVAAANKTPSEQELLNLFPNEISVAAKPISWRMVETLPLSLSGQIDYGRLQRMETKLESRTEKDVYLAPRNNIETRLVELWATTFGATRIGIRDDFFRLGGHSLLATRIVAQIADEFGVSLSLGSFFTSPTIEGLSELIGQHGSIAGKLPSTTGTKIDHSPGNQVVNVEQLSDQDVDTLLATLLKEQS